MSQAVVTRFAPSPTGFLHIGGARTALFNWLYARGRGGKFLLRIEDTDRARHNTQAVDAILNGLTWLGIDWDGEPVSQYARQERHIEAAQTLLKSGRAYRCYLSPDAIETARLQSRESGTPFESPWRDADLADAPDTPYSIRFKAPREGETIVNDAVQGQVRFPNSALDDLIILRSDGSPTYNLAVVVDDHDMDVTHVIRGDDHLNNAARQQQIYDALDWPVPVFAHVPLIHGQDGAKLSKRNGALGVQSYRDLGYLPEGLANYLLRLGWSHGDDEIITQEEALGWFDLTAINKAPARLDLEKLNHVNAHYIRKLDDKDFVDKATPFIETSAGRLDGAIHARLMRAAPFMKARCETLKGAPDAAAFLLTCRPLQISGKAAKPLRKDTAQETLRAAQKALSLASNWDSALALETVLQELAAHQKMSFGQIGQPLRAALTGGASAPSLGEVLFSLGREESLSRIGDHVM